MGRKSERIAALEKANADLIALNRGLVRENVELRRILDQRENGPVSVSVGDSGAVGVRGADWAPVSGGGAVMADFTDDDVARLAEMLRPHFVSYTSPESLAHLLLEQGVTLPPPPPDPADVVVKALRSAAADDDRLVLAYAVRDLFPTDALEAAAAKVQEAGK